MYILKLNILVPYVENLDLESEITMKLEELLANSQACFVSTEYEEVSGENFGQCVSCGCWASDHREANHITAFSNGVKVEKGWLCDICLPEDHPEAF